MSRFIRGVLLVVILSLLAIGLELYLAIRYHEVKPDAYIMSYFAKREVLRAKVLSGEPMLILYGGSNVAFGFDSAMLRDSLGVPVYNAATTATIGIKFMLDDIPQYLFAGDVLIFSPEYEHFYGVNPYGKLELDRLFCLSPLEISRDFNIYQYQKVLEGRLGYVQQQISQRMRSTDPGYKSTGFDSNGDYVAHRGKAGRAVIQQSSLSDFGKINHSFLRYYGRVIGELRSRGIEVLIVPPSLSRTSYELTKTYILELLPVLDSYGVGFCCDPYELVYSDDLFFDSSYHLGSAGIVMRTSHLLRLLGSEGLPKSEKFVNGGGKLVNTSLGFPHLVKPPCDIDRVCGFFHVPNRHLPHSGMSSPVIPSGLDRVCGFFHVSNRLLLHSGMSSSIVTLGLDCGSGFFHVPNCLLLHSGMSSPVATLGFDRVRSFFHVSNCLLLHSGRSLSVIPGLDPGSPFAVCLRIPLTPDYHVI